MSDAFHIPSKRPATPRPGPEPSKAPVTHTGIRSQADRRELVTYRDQHRNPKWPEGRPWWGYRELPADPMEAPGIVGSMTPGDHEDPWGPRWDAPWLPHEKYLDYDHRRQLIRVRYDKMIGDYTTANRTYYAAANKIAAQNGWTAPSYGSTLQQRFIDIIGPLPQSVKIPQAAQAGDPWLLGFSQEPNELLAKVLRETSYGEWEGLSYDDAYLAAQGTALSTPQNVLTMSPEQLQALINDAVAKAVAPKKRSNAEGLAKARAAKADKSAAQAAANAA